MRLNWSARAVARLNAIHDYIARENPGAALKVVQQVLQRAEQIAAFPNSGRRVADYAREDVRELIEGEYRIVYRVGVDRIDVLTVKHCAQVLPPDMRRL